MEAQAVEWRVTVWLEVLQQKCSIAYGLEMMILCHSFEVMNTLTPQSGLLI